MTEPTREQLALALCEGLSDEQIKNGPKTAKLWDSFNIAYYQVQLLAEAIEDVLKGTRFEDAEHRDGNGIMDVLDSGPTLNQLKLWGSILKGTLEQACKIKPGDIPNEYRTGDELIANEGIATPEDIDQGVPELPMPDFSQIH